MSLIERKVKEIDDDITPSQKRRTNKEDKETSKLQSDEIDLAAPLSMCDWKNIITGTKDLKGIAWMQILPKDQKSAHPLQFNTLHLIPGSKIEVDKIPLDKLALSEIDKLMNDEGSVHPKKEAFELDQYTFPHAIQGLNKKDDEEDMINTYKNLYNKLGLEK